MVNAIPKWVWNRYAFLWNEIGGKPFTFEEAQKKLKHLDRNLISVMFNELKKAGWIKVSLDEKDTRKRIYTLVNPTTVVESSEYDIKRHKS